jgi:DNA-binding Lrp family transcriptional regulator
VADVVGAGPVATEVPPLDHQVGRDDDVAVLDAQHGGVVTGADEHVLVALEDLAELGDELGDQAELARLAEGCVCCRCHAPIPPDRGGDHCHPSPVGAAARRGRLCRSHPMNETEESTMVVQAYILIQTDVGKAAEVAREIAQVNGVTLAEDVTGPYDVIVRAEAKNVDELGKLVVSKVQNLDGITRTLTCPVVHI